MKWFEKPKIGSKSTPDCLASILYDERSFYNKFTKDLLTAEKEVIIESPYITIPRLDTFKHIFEDLVNKGVAVFIVTKDPSENDDEAMAEQAEAGIRYFEVLGAQVLLIAGGHHRKLAMIDRKLLWEGSLNILSQRNSREFMRRIESRELTEKMFKFLKYDKVNFFKRKITL